MADKKPILVVAEDEQIVADVIRLAFGKEYDVRMFDNAQQALQAVHDAGRPVVLLTDIGLQPAPDGTTMNGLQLLDRVKKELPETSVVVLTGYASKQAQEQIENAGAILLHKPAGIPDLSQALQAAQRKIDGPRGPMDHGTRPQDERGLF